MKNFEKFNIKERVLAFQKICMPYATCIGCKFCGKHLDQLECFSHWLDLEAEEEKPLPCPFCGSECGVLERGMVYCMNVNNACGYKVWREGLSPDDMVKEHNRVAKAVMGTKAGGAE